MFGTHITNRIIIDENTTEFVLQILRSGSLKPTKLSDISVCLEKRECKKTNLNKIDISPYAVKDGYAYFTIPDKFRTEYYPKGIYELILKICDCEIDRIELLKSATPFINESHIHDDSCDDSCQENGWSEPSHCTPEPEPEPKKKDVNCDCPGTEITIVTPKIDVGEKI